MIEFTPEEAGKIYRSLLALAEKEESDRRGYYDFRKQAAETRALAQRIAAKEAAR